MKQVTIDGKNYTAECGEDGRIVLTPEPELPTSNWQGFVVFSDGKVSINELETLSFNSYKSCFFAKKQVLPAWRIFHALWQVKEHVEPDFVPDWNDKHQLKRVICFDFGRGEWIGDTWHMSDYNTPAFSTAEKRDRAIEILNHWGVRP